jgi:amino acid transporter
MAFCENCGKPVYRLDRTCANCGAPVTQFAQPAYTESQSSVRMDADPMQSSPYAVLSSWGFVGSMLLMAIPFAGFIITIVWAAGGTANLNRRNLARGYLLLMGIVLAIYVLLVIALVASGSSAYFLNELFQ